MAIEAAGIPTVVNTCEAFITQSKAIGALGGVPWVNVVVYPGHIDTYSVEERNKYIAEDIVPGSEKALTTQIPATAATGVAQPPETTPVVFP